MFKLGIDSELYDLICSYLVALPMVVSASCSQCVTLAWNEETLAPKVVDDDEDLWVCGGDWKQIWKGSNNQHCLLQLILKYPSMNLKLNINWWVSFRIDGFCFVFVFGLSY